MPNICNNITLMLDSWHKVHQYLSWCCTHCKPPESSRHIRFIFIYDICPYIRHFEILPTVSRSMIKYGLHLKEEQICSQKPSRFQHSQIVHVILHFQRRRHCYNTNTVHQNNTILSYMCPNWNAAKWRSRIEIQNEAVGQLEIAPNSIVILTSSVTL